MIKVLHFPAAISDKGAVEAVFSGGLSVAEILTGKPDPVGEEYDFCIHYGQDVIARDKWHSIWPHDDSTLIVRPNIRGGDDSGGKSPVIMILAALAVVAASLILGPWVGATLFGTIFSASVATSLGIAIVGTVGSLLLNALTPPAAPTALVDASGSGSKTSPNFNISGARNALQPWGVVPLILGRHRIVPPLGARTYTELRGSSQFLRMLVVWGYGRLDIEDIKIGDSSVTGFDDVTIETLDGSAITPLHIFPGQVVELPLSILLKESDGFQTRTSGANADELSVDIAFPRGLFEVDTQTGKKQKLNVTVALGYRLVGDSVWIARPNFAEDAKKQEAFGVNQTWSVDRGSYEVRLRRVTGDRDDTNQIDEVAWTALRAITNEDPILFPKALAKTALVIRATEQLSGVVDDLNAVVTSYAPVWNGAAWIADAPTNNPAALYRLLLQGPSIARPIPDVDINLEDLGYWFDFCENRGLKFNMIIDFEAKLWDVLSMVCAAGLASPAIRDGKWTIVIDEPKEVIAGHYSPHNSKGFEGEIVFMELPHAWRCRFINETDDLFVNDERVVYREGFNEGNATIFEGIDFPGVTDPAQVYKLATRHLAVATLRPQKYSFEIGIQSLLVTRGDRIKFVHDAPEFGLGSGRIKSLEGDGGYPSELLMAIHVDNAMPMETGKNYGIRVQRSNGTSQYINLITFAGYQTRLQVLDTVLMDGAPEIGDHFLYGEAFLESVDLLVKGVQAQDAFSARLQCIDYAPEVFDVDSNVIPAYNPNITTPPNIGVKPPTPIILSLQSDIGVATLGNDGSIVERVLVTVRAPDGYNPSEVIVEGQSRFQGSTQWSSIFTQSRPDYVYIADVSGGEIYDIRVRFRTVAGSRTPGTVSDWTLVTDHTVVGKTDLPPNPIQLKLEGGRAVWTMPEIPLDLAGFEMRFNKGTSVSWDQGVPVQDNLILTTDYNLAWLKGGEHTLMVKSVDTGGRQSEGFSAMVVDLGDPFFGNVFKEVDYRADGFGLDGETVAEEPYGTVIGGSIVSVNLAADVTAGYWGANPSAPFWQAGSSDFWQDNAIEMTYETYYTSLPEEIGIDMGLLTTIQAKNYTISYRTDGDELFFSGNDDENIFNGNEHGLDENVTLALDAIGVWRLWPGKLRILGRQRYHFRVITAPGTIQGIISQFVVALDVPDIIEEFENFGIAIAGTRLPIIEVYDVIKTVLTTIQDDGGAAVYAKAMDKNNALGPLVKCFNVAGTAVAGVVDARVVGYNQNG